MDSPHNLHDGSIAKKARKLVGLLYRHFYKTCSTSTLLSLYYSIVRPVLEYASIIWDSAISSHSSIIEPVQSFALKVVCKSWSTPYLTPYILLKSTDYQPDVLS